MIKIGAQEIIKVLRKHSGKAFTTLELSELLEESRRTISRAIASLLKECDKTREIDYRFLTNEEKKQRYKRLLATNIRVYFIK